MATDIIHTLKPSGQGGDYSSIAAWESAQQRDLVDADENAVLECYGGDYGGLNGALDEVVTISQWTASLTQRPIIRAATGEEHNGVRRADGGTGFAWTTDAGANTLRINNTVDLIDIEINKDPGTSGKTIVTSMEAQSPNKISFIRCILYNLSGTGSGNAAVETLDSNLDEIYAENCLVRGGAGFSIYNVGINATYYNNSIYCEAQWGITAHPSATTVSRNNVVRAPSSGFDSISDPDYDISSDSSASGTNSVTLVDLDTAGLNWVDAANNNFKPVEGGAVDGSINAGADLSGTFTTDVSGATRSLPWERGAWEIVGTSVVPIEFVGTIKDGSASVGVEGSLRTDAFFIGTERPFIFSYTDTPSLPASISFDTGTGTFSGTPQIGDEGTYQLTVHGDDQADSPQASSNQFAFTIFRAPTFDGPDIPDEINEVNTQLNIDTEPLFSVYAEPETYELVSLNPIPGTVAIDPNTGVITGTSAVAADNPEIYVRVTDSNTLSGPGPYEATISATIPRVHWPMDEGYEEQPASPFIVHDRSPNNLDGTSGTIFSDHDIGPVFRSGLRAMDTGTTTAGCYVTDSASEHGDRVNSGQDFAIAWWMRNAQLATINDDQYLMGNATTESAVADGGGWQVVWREADESLDVITFEGNGAANVHNFTNAALGDGTNTVFFTLSYDSSTGELTLFRNGGVLSGGTEESVAFSPGAAYGGSTTLRVGAVFAAGAAYFSYAVSIWQWSYHHSILTDGIIDTLSDEGRNSGPGEAISNPFRIQFTEAGQDVQMGQAVESDAGLPWAVSNPMAIQMGQAQETDAALSWTPVQAQAIQMGQAVESDSALPWSVQGLPISVQLGQAVEADTALPWTPTVRTAVQMGQAVETDAALPWGVDAPIVVQMGQAVESDTALPWRASYAQPIQMGQATEVDTAFSFTPYISEPVAEYPYFRPGDYRSMYARFLGPLAQEVTLLVNNGTGFDPVPGVRAHVSRWKENDLVPDGPIEVGDLKLIILAESLPDGQRALEQKDRIQIDGRAYGVILWDPFSRSIGDQPMAIEATVRG